MSEREQFEAHYAAIWKERTFKNESLEHLMTVLVTMRDDDDYNDGHGIKPIFINTLWQGWKAGRAALATHAGAAAAAEPIYQIAGAFADDPKCTWRDASKSDYDMHIASKRRILYAAALTSAPAVPEAKDPVELYEGWTVFNALSDKAKTRTSPENVSDTLDAVVRLIRSRADLKGVQPGERGEG